MCICLCLRIFVFLSSHVSVCPGLSSAFVSAYMFRPLYHCLFVCPEASLSVYPNVCLSVYLSISLCVSIYQFVCLSIYLSVCVSVYLSACMSDSIRLSMTVSICVPSGRISVWLSVCMYVPLARSHPFVYGHLLPRQVATRRPSLQSFH